MINIHILHAGIAHKSPYFYNFCKELEKFDDFSYVMHYFLLTAARVGFDFEIRLCDEQHLDSPLVWVFTPKEILDTFSE